MNAPGSLHDSTLATWGGVYDAINSVYERTGGMCCVDSAFASDDNPSLIKSAQDTTKANSARELAFINQATSLRQAAEWGMHAIQSSMSRLKDRFLYEEEEKQHREREVALKLVPLLYNFRLEHVGLSQIVAKWLSTKSTWPSAAVMTEVSFHLCSDDISKRARESKRGNCVDLYYPEFTGCLVRTEEMVACKNKKGNKLVGKITAVDDLRDICAKLDTFEMHNCQLYVLSM